MPRADTDAGNLQSERELQEPLRAAAAGERRRSEKGARGRGCSGWVAYVRDGDDVEGRDPGPGAALRRCVKSWQRAVGCDNIGTCRCGSASSSGCVLLFVVCLSLLVVGVHRAALGVTNNHRCLAGPASTYKVKAGDSCASIAAAHRVPLFDVVDRNKTKSCCEFRADKNEKELTIDKGDVIELCNVPSAENGHPWVARGLPGKEENRRDKIVMTYIGGIGYINHIAYPVPTALPAGVNVVALAFAQDADGKGRFEMGTHPHCKQPNCAVGQGSGFDGDCATHVDPSFLFAGRGHGERLHEADQKRRWTVSIVPREGNEWPYYPGWQPEDHGGVTAPADWGNNAFESLKEIILRYRLDGIDVDFEAAAANRDKFHTAMCTLFTKLKEWNSDVIISAAFYGNPGANKQTIPLYQDLKAQCDDKIDFYNYQNYANWVDSVPASLAAIKAMGDPTTGFGWEKIVWGVGVGGQSGSAAWRWWPSDPGYAAYQMMQELLNVAPSHAGVFTWAGEFSKQSCTPKWCIETHMAAMYENGRDWQPPTGCTCTNG